MPAGLWTRSSLVALALLATGAAARAQAPLVATPAVSPRPAGPLRATAVLAGLPPSVTTGVITMTGLLGTPVPRLPAEVTAGALSMTGLLGGRPVSLPASVTAPPIRMTGAAETSGRRVQ